MNWNFTGGVIIQGVARPQVWASALRMKAYGTNLVAGIGTRSQEGEKDTEIPVFDLVEPALAVVGQVETSLIAVEPYQVLDAGREAIAAGIKNLVILTPRVPPLDAVELLKQAEIHQVSILGPNSPGVIIPQKVSWGNLQTKYFRPGNIALISYSEYLAYEVVWELNRCNWGQSILIGLSQDRIVGSSLTQWLNFLEEDPQTEAIVWIQKASNLESSVVECFRENTTKPVIAYIANCQTPEERNFKDAMTILSNHLSHSIPATSAYKKTLSALKKIGVAIAKRPSEVPELIKIEK